MQTKIAAACFTFSDSRGGLTSTKNKRQSLQERKYPSERHLIHQPQKKVELCLSDLSVAIDLFDGL